MEETNPNVVWIKSTKSQLYLQWSSTVVKSWQDWNQNSPNGHQMKLLPFRLWVVAWSTWSLLLTVQSMGGAGLSGTHRGHSRKAAAKALQELAPLRKPPLPESSFTPAYPETLRSTFRVLSSPAIWAVRAVYAWAWTVWLIQAMAPLATK